ncbi:putative C6 transcription factor [Planoprotostelium fungivorum]|uniref:Putative C6 transcription factor n=1 Tax=Planoprotostelium fungivorum TaxID=1890364 RepID=A0A2P6N410_9EUKA|nr:putative C6 transcription factor [Planoprotostelium fungivorum]
MRPDRALQRGLGNIEAIATGPLKAVSHSSSLYKRQRQQFNGSTAMATSHHQDTSPNRSIIAQKLSSIRMRTKTACTSCRREHAHCDDNRPCRRCYMRGQPHNCIDVERKRRGKSNQHDALSHTSVANTPTASTTPSTISFQDPFLLNEVPSFDTIPRTQGCHTKHILSVQDVTATSLQDLTMDLHPNQHDADHPNNFLRWTAPGLIEGLPPSLWFRPWHIDMVYSRLIERGAFTMEEGTKWMNKTIQTNGKKISDLQIFVTSEQRKVMTEEHLSLAQSISDTCASSPIPSLVWMSCCIVVHANDAFRHLTGYNETSPSKLEDLSVLNLLDHSTIRVFMHSLLKEGAMTTGPCHKSMPASVRYLRDTSTERYIQGTLTLSITRDIFGLPTFYTAHFLPLPSLLGEFPSVEDRTSFCHLEGVHHVGFALVLSSGAARRSFLQLEKLRVRKVTFDSCSEACAIVSRNISLGTTNHFISRSCVSLSLANTAQQNWQEFCCNNLDVVNYSCLFA